MYAIHTTTLEVTIWSTSNADKPTGQVSSGFITLDGHLVRGLRLSIMQGIYEGDDVKEMCFLRLAETYDILIEFAPDDPPSLLKGAYGTVDGLSNLVKMSWKISGERGIAEVSEEDTGVAASSPACDLPSELVEAFVEDAEYPRFTRFSILKESKKEKCKYKRLGRFDVWGRNDIGVA
ncbi:hypothetical protein CTAM01_12497 [Colletotrichum tamarilloi]|uniref:Uncharacterized protein n=1 Tax=Colletotrichum tamarilloi TaxID=1209934 RepID=A0ABQ9QUQ6_9PEZI|nr:uncharacterized protein CTAM01_12497 [Colletotrichum tamarilloi]KAK1485547.1 hypothetical protein CTAM01_12497 [Colletotrichum tamarilloi]